MFEIKLPKLTEIELAARYKNLKPIVKNDNGKLSWIKSFDKIKDLKTTSYTWDPKFVREVKDDELIELQCFDQLCLSPYAYYGFFKPTIEEVLCQLDSTLMPLDSDITLRSHDDFKTKIVAFEIIEQPETMTDFHKTDLHTAVFNAGYHVFKVRFYGSFKNFNGYPEGV